jgi:Na+/H+-dicarboxylate symporter
MKSQRTNLLTVLIFVGLGLGVVYGLVLHGRFDPDQPLAFDWLKEAGDIILIRPLKMLIIPLVFTSVVVGITSIGDPGKLGRVGLATVVYYMTTMFLAVTLGAILVSTIQPGVGLAFDPGEVAAGYEVELAEQVQDAPDRLGAAWLNILRQLVPTNVVQAAAEGQPLPVISFSILLGLGLATLGKRGKPAVRFFRALFEAIMKVVSWILWLTPVGVFLLVAWTIGTKGIGVGTNVAAYMATVVSGLLIHGALVLPLILMVLARTNPFRFMWQMRPALVTAFGTDSSSATLPITIESAQRYGGVSKRSSEFVLPLGATINMDGTALYEAVAVVFMFQAYGISLGFEQLATVVITATLAAVGAAGIPSAGLVTMVIVVQAVNATLPESTPTLPLTAIGLLWGVDRLLDMCRTTVNVWGDAVGAKLITRLAPDPPGS